MMNENIIKAKTKVKHLYNFLKRENHIKSEIKKSAYFKGFNIADGFKDRFQPTEDPEIINRIIKSYNKAKHVQKNLPEAYQVGNEWLPIYDQYMGEIMNALSTENTSEVNKIYENFMRHNCSVGLHGLPVDMKRAYFSNEISTINRQLYTLDLVHRISLWRTLLGNSYSIDVLKMPNYGNAYGFETNNHFIRTGAEYLHYYSVRIGSLLKETSEDKIVVELGGGYGGLGYFLNRDIDNLTYIDFDLPENMALTSYFLLNCFPQKKILLFGEEEFTEEIIKKYDIIVLPSFELKKLPTKKINLAFNSYSLAEMSEQTINEYIPELCRSVRDYILHVNHTKHCSSLTADEFGIPLTEYNLISKTKARWNEGRNFDMDEFEYLYKRHELS
jgi:putative sugar O-methyltransferase